MVTPSNNHKAVPLRSETNNPPPFITTLTRAGLVKCHYYIGSCGMAHKSNMQNYIYTRVTYLII